MLESNSRKYAFPSPIQKVDRLAPWNRVPAMQLDTPRGGNESIAAGKATPPVQVRIDGPNTVLLLGQALSKPIQDGFPASQGGQILGGSHLRSPDSDGLEGLSTLPIREILPFQPRSEHLGRLCGWMGTELTGEPVLDPAFVVSMVPERDPLADQRLPIPSQVHSGATRTTAQRGIGHNTKFYVLSTNRQAQPGLPPHPDAHITRNSSHKHEFHIISVLGRPSGRDFAS